jgi:hypothetical protein
MRERGEEWRVFQEEQASGGDIVNPDKRIQILYHNC